MLRSSLEAHLADRHWRWWITGKVNQLLEWKKMKIQSKVFLLACLKTIHKMFEDLNRNEIPDAEDVNTLGMQIFDLERSFND